MKTLLGLVAGAAACAGVARADMPLYQAQAITTGTTAATRGAGFADCLADVLVKVSGDPRLLRDSRVAALRERAGAFVQAFRYRDRMEGIPVHDEQGTRDRPYDLTCDFDRAKVDAALRALGREPWIAARPRLAVFLAVRNGPVAYALTEDGTRGPGQRESLQIASKRMGMPVALPTQAALAAAELDVARIDAAEPAALDALAPAAGGDRALVGTMRFSDEAHGWIAEWRLADGGATQRWRVSGVNFDEVFRVGLRGAAQVLSGNGAPG